MPWSRLYLPRLQPAPATILEHVITHFPQIPAQAWHSRVERGLILFEDGTPLRQDSPYRHGITIFYRKETPSEPPPTAEEIVLYRDERILVCDKPHGMIVTPVGEHVERSLLARLRKSTGLDTVAPMHRLDRETAGVTLFNIDPPSRRLYHRMFEEGAVEREYFALSEVIDAPDRSQWLVQSRIVAGVPWFRQQTVAGPVNAVTEIEIVERRGIIGLFRLRPATGRKHQLRVHMAAIGFPILGDPLYPEIIGAQSKGAVPLQLLAKSLSFVDPVSGKPHRFVSPRRLWVGSSEL